MDLNHPCSLDGITVVGTSYFPVCSFNSFQVAETQKGVLQVPHCQCSSSTSSNHRGMSTGTGSCSSTTTNDANCGNRDITTGRPVDRNSYFGVLELTSGTSKFEKVVGTTV